jgi:RimJ/RimL family protein N-acetyltransferase
VGLRRPERGDAALYHRMRNDLNLVNAVMGFRLGVSRRSVEEWIDRVSSQNDDIVYTAVSLADGARPIGYVKAFRFDRAARTCWVGLSVFDLDDAGRGRVLALVLGFLERQVGMRKVSLEVLADNSRAIALYRRLGFVEEGRLARHALVDGKFVDVLILSVFVGDGRPAT